MDYFSSHYSMLLLSIDALFFIKLLPLMLSSHSDLPFHWKQAWPVLLCLAVCLSWKGTSTEVQYNNIAINFIFSLGFSFLRRYTNPGILWLAVSLSWTISLTELLLPLPPCTLFFFFHRKYSCPDLSRFCQCLHSAISTMWG